MKTLKEHLEESILMEAGIEAKKANKVATMIKNEMKKIAKEYDGASKAQPMRWEAPIVDGKSLNDFRSTSLHVDLEFSPDIKEWNDDECEKVFEEITDKIAKTFGFDIKGKDADMMHSGGGRGFQWYNGMRIEPNGSVVNKAVDNAAFDMDEVLNGKFVKHEGDVHYYPFAIGCRVWNERQPYTFTFTVSFDITVANIE